MLKEWRRVWVKLISNGYTVLPFQYLSRVVWSAKKSFVDEKQEEKRHFEGKILLKNASWLFHTHLTTGFKLLRNVLVILNKETHGDPSLQTLILQD